MMGGITVIQVTTEAIEQLKEIVRDPNKEVVRLYIAGAG